MQLRDLFIQALHQPLVVEIKAEPDEQGKRNLTQDRKDQGRASAVSWDPAGGKCGDQHDRAANAHVNQRFQGERETVVLIDQRGKAKTQPDDKGSENHLGEAVVIHTEVPMEVKVDDQTDDTEDDGGDADRNSCAA